MAQKYSQPQLLSALQQLNASLTPELHWQMVDGKLSKTFKFESFISAFGWMTKIAVWAEKLNHHPEWFNLYNKVEVRLTTHDVEGISELDFNLAEKMELFH